MANNIVESNLNQFKEFSTRAFGGKRHQIVENLKPLTYPKVCGYGVVLSAVTGFSCTDLLLDPEGGSWVTDLPVGMELPEGLTNVSVAQGSILFFLRT